MRCFYHTNAEAVGSCKNCGRGLCPSCVSEVEDGIACKGRCEEKVLALSRLVNRTKNLAPIAGTPYLVIASLLCLMGLTWVVRGLAMEDESVLNFITVSGIVGLAIGVWFFRIAVRIRKA